MFNVKDNNKVKIEGILSEIDMKYTSYMKDGVSHDAISGTIKVRVNQVIDGKEVELEVPVSVFSNKYTKEGKVNGAYESLERVMNEYVSIAKVGIEAADHVRITGAQIRMNEYYNQNGTLVSFPRINATFINKISASDCKPEATFVTTFVVGKAGYAVDADGVEDTSCYKIKAILPQWGQTVDVVEFIARTPSVIDAVSSYWQEGDTVKASGRLNFSSRTEVTYQEVDFGEPIKQERTISVSELILTGGSATPLEGDFAYDADEIREALAKRTAKLEADKAKKASQAKNSTKAAPAAGKGFADLGF